LKAGEQHYDSVVLTDERHRPGARSEAMLRAVPDLMFLQSLDGVFLDYHAGRREHLFVPPESFLGKNMREVLPPAAIEVLEAAFARVASAAEPVVVEYDLPMQPHTRSFEARLIRNDNDQVLTLVRDVTERRRAEDALREGRQRYSLATAAGAVGVWDWNLESNHLYIDPGLKLLLGFDDHEISTAPEDWGSRIHPEDAPLGAAAVQACIDGTSETYEVEHRMLHKDGSVKWMLSRGSALRTPDGRLQRLVGTKVDITARKKAEELVRENQAVLEASHRENQNLAGRLIAAQDIERARIARDLHDDFGQQIAGLSIAISSLKRRIAVVRDPAALSKDVAALEQRAMGLAESMRNLSHDLHPSVLAQLGLIAALAAYCAELERQQTLSVTFKADGDFDALAPTVALCLYRVTQEALRNVVRHANAKRAEVALNRLEDAAELTIWDDGGGFDIPAANGRRQGLGLVSIHERVRLEGGTVTIVTELNKGTRLRVTFPNKRSIHPRIDSQPTVR
jgi:PAS domain S-box-containing protein